MVFQWEGRPEKTPGGLPLLGQIPVHLVLVEQD